MVNGEQQQLTTNNQQENTNKTLTPSLGSNADTNYRAYPDTIAYLPCRSCKINKRCPAFKNTYKQYYTVAKDEILPELKKVKAEVYHKFHEKQGKLKEVEELFEQRVAQLLDDDETSCVYEKQHAAALYNDFAINYQLETEPTLKHLLYTIIGQMIMQIRLQKTVSMTDIIQTKVIMTKQGTAEIDVVTPSLRYAMQINEQTSKMLKDFHELVKGKKINLEGKLTIKDVMNKIVEMHNDS